mmetsp:Transcript_42444/g.90382  ORF Transcript_42444/g.90382 Transcript_42444/m.90382 type:complete len:181 (+) Transcript_42444:2-544(+)
MPQKGDTVSFDVVDSDQKPGTKKAANVTGGSAPAKGVLGSGAFQGTVKSFAASTGYGFINYPGGQIFVHLAECKGGRPQEGDTVAFDIEQSKTKPGQTTAVNVTGGTASLFVDDWSGGKGKGKDGKKGGGKGWDMDWGYGPMMKGGWGGCGWDGPYGGGFGGKDAWGKGKGWGKGPWGPW